MSMTPSDPEMLELQEWYRSDPPLRAIIGAVLAAEGCSTVHGLFCKNSDVAFELHDEIAGLLVDTGTVGDFEHDLEREVM